MWDTVFLFLRSHNLGNKESKKSLILASKMNNEKIGKKKRITTCLGDWIVSSTLFSYCLTQGSPITFCHECFWRCHISSCILLLTLFALFLDSASELKLELKRYQNCLCLQTIHFPSWVARNDYNFSWKMCGVTEPEFCLQNGQQFLCPLQNQLDCLTLILGLVETLICPQ